MTDSQYELGALTQAVTTLTAEVKHLREKVECLESRMNQNKGFAQGFGKGFLVGLTLFAGGIGAGAYSLISKVFGK